MTGLWFDACRRLDSNALVCDCEMVWLVQMLQDKLKGTQAAATCQYPIAMQGKSLTAMTETDFHCGEYHRNTEAPASCNVFAVTCLPLTLYLSSHVVIPGLCFLSRELYEGI
jgi:hypothetical protein